MAFWTEFWTIVLIGGIAMFAVLSVVVTVGGWFDIRSLFESIRAQHTIAESEDRDPSRESTARPD